MNKPVLSPWEVKSSVLNKVLAITHCLPLVLFKYPKASVVFSNMTRKMFSSCGLLQLLSAVEKFFELLKKKRYKDKVIVLLLHIFLLFL